MLSFAEKVYRKMHGGIDAMKSDRLKRNFSLTNNSDMHV